MGDNHLSELCRGTEVLPIELRLRHLASDDMTDINEETDAATAYAAGIWGYRDEDGRTAFHWAVALKNCDLAAKLMGPPYNSPVLTEDNDGVTPFESACAVGAPDNFVKDLLERSAAAYEVFKKCPSLQNTMKEAKPAAPPLQHPRTEEATAPTEDGGSAPAAPSEATAAIEEPTATPATANGAEPEAADTPTTTIPTAAAIDPALSAVINHEDELKNTPLLLAVGRGHKWLVRLLLESGADLNHQNDRGQSALHRAVSRGDVDLIEELVRASEKVHTSKIVHRRWMNLRDYRGDTALFYASMENNEDAGRFLLSHGADRDYRNKDGKQFWEV